MWVYFVISRCLGVLVVSLARWCTVIGPAFMIAGGDLATSVFGAVLQNKVGD